AMSNTPQSPAQNEQDSVQTWVKSQWKNPPIPGQISAAINSLSLLCDLEAGLWILGGYGFVLLSHLTVGIHAFGMYPMRRQQGLPVRSSLETDENFHQLTRFTERRLSIALLAAAFLLPDWQTVGAGLMLIRILDLSGLFLLAVGGTMAIVSASHPVTWQELFDSETGAFKGGRS
ncbi:hypothetical protein ACSHT0_17420, partial [Tepidicaulis sp. LMO-SS28]|uniref:hypothetical protein n=1 Tax=Tepidicaulis sp. LMO-SS28 TaxID=3447455 RepID=UPI003EDF81A3